MATHSPFLGHCEVPLSNLYLLVSILCHIHCHCLSQCKLGNSLRHGNQHSQYPKVCQEIARNSETRYKLQKDFRAQEIEIKLISKNA